MTISLSNITGATVTGLTSPTYTVTADTAPSTMGKQWTVSALGGTQTGVDVHSISKPFTIAFFRPSALRTLPSALPTTGVVPFVPKNSYKVITRKGALPALNQSVQTAFIKTEFVVPAGVDSYEPEELRAMVSAHIGALNQQADALATLLLTGTL